jgi:hypothetical protein
MKKFTMFVSILALALSSAAFAGGGAGEPAAPLNPAIKLVKTCQDFRKFTWKDLLGFELPKSYPTLEAACEEIRKTHPDVANGPVWALPYVYMLKKNNCIQVIVGDRQNGGQYNQEAPGNALRLSDPATRAEVFASEARMLVPLMLGICTVTREEWEAGMATLTANTTQQLADLKALLIQLQGEGRLNQQFLAELQLRINQRMDDLAKQGSDNAGRISVLTSFAQLIETHLRSYYGYDPSRSGYTNGVLKLTFVNLDGKVSTLEVKIQSGTTVAVERDSEGFAIAIVIDGIRTPLRQATASTPGIGVTNAAINASGDLIITLSNGQVLNAGPARGKDGIGTQGLAGTNGINGVNCYDDGRIGDFNKDGTKDAADCVDYMISKIPAPIVVTSTPNQPSTPATSGPECGVNNTAICDCLSTLSPAAINLANNEKLLYNNQVVNGGAQRPVIVIGNQWYKGDDAVRFVNDAAHPWSPTNMWGIIQVGSNKGKFVHVVVNGTAVTMTVE